MELELSDKVIDAIAYKVAKMVTTAEAAKILHVSKEYMRQIGYRFPRVKGEGRNGRVLYVRSALLQNY